MMVECASLQLKYLFYYEFCRKKLPMVTVKSLVRVKVNVHLK